MIVVQVVLCCILQSIKHEIEISNSYVLNVKRNNLDWIDRLENSIRATSFG